MKRYKTRHKILVCVFPVLCAAALYLISKAVFVSLPLPRCFTHTVFNVYCPGCGLTRSVFALIRGDLLMSLRQNAVVVLGAALAAVYYVEFALRIFGKRFRIGFLHSMNFFYAIVAALAVYTLLRNLFPALAPVEIF